ncbi:MULTISPECIES: hypothetical protein [Glycomyces]|uniref:Uncharacterized protein n=1 Tax=Glycomyces lechevalierae TaxID=256034 RepID=A0A9X3PV82_9ACTN|nr:hypothetical protein [Glycomyces lechevalierae]MDA1386393.1 hypothetical protein [Glycomyces lechevalierae]MDR7338909.1 hypothetical protein [Glycomyces lechevalierae]
MPVPVVAVAERVVLLAGPEHLEVVVEGADAEAVDQLAVVRRGLGADLCRDLRPVDARGRPLAHPGALGERAKPVVHGNSQGWKETGPPAR